MVLLYRHCDKSILIHFQWPCISVSSLFFMDLAAKLGLIALAGTQINSRFGLISVFLTVVLHYPPPDESIRASPTRLKQTQFQANNSNPSSSHPVTPPIIFLTGRCRRANLTAALSAPLQCGPAQYTTNKVSAGYCCKLSSLMRE